MELGHDIDDRNHALVVSEREAAKGCQEGGTKDEWRGNEPTHAVSSIRHMFCQLCRQLDAVCWSNLLVQGTPIVNILGLSGHGTRFIPGPNVGEDRIVKVMGDKDDNAGDNEQGDLPRRAGVHVFMQNQVMETPLSRLLNRMAKLTCDWQLDDGEA